MIEKSNTYIYGHLRTYMSYTCICVYEIYIYIYLHIYMYIFVFFLPTALAAIYITVVRT